MPAGGTGGAAGAAGDTGSECTTDPDCPEADECYSSFCQADTCVVSALARGTPCETGFCDGVEDAAQCVVCINNSSSLQDSGCSADAPACDESVSPPACVECTEATDCDDDNDCTEDRCSDLACEHDALPAGNECGAGVCNGTPDEDACVPCLDDADAGLDTGCSDELPACDSSRAPATCAQCTSAADCDDDNDCTSESCHEGVCQYETVLGGTPCAGGYCNGEAGAEACVVVECASDADCDDGVDCTSEVCGDDQVCVYSADQGECPDSGDVCTPDLCLVNTGCEVVDIAKTVELLSNGNLDAGTVDWTMTSVNYDRVIFADDYVPRLTADSPPNVAWLGGGEANPDEVNSMSQLVHVPEGTVSLELSFAYQIHAEDLPDNHNESDITLRATDDGQTDQEFVTFYNQDKPLEDETLDWTWDDYSTTLDASAWAGSDATLEFTGTGVNGYTHFFYDSISLIATVCQ